MHYHRGHFKPASTSPSCIYDNNRVVLCHLCRRKMAWNAEGTHPDLCALKKVTGINKQHRSLLGVRGYEASETAQAVSGSQSAVYRQLYHRIAAEYTCAMKRLQYGPLPTAIGPAVFLRCPQLFSFCNEQTRHQQEQQARPCSKGTVNLYTHQLAFAIPVSFHQLFSTCVDLLGQTMFAASDATKSTPALHQTQQ